MNEVEVQARQADLGALVVALLKGVVYEDSDSKRWAELIGLHNRIRDYVSVIGLELILDEAEGYAFLRGQADEDEQTDDAAQTVPRLVTRRQLSFPVSLLLALLRKRMMEADASGGELRLILSREQITDLIRLFLPDSSNEVKLVDQVERHINKVVELGFLRVLKASSGGQPQYEVRRILKAFIDAQWLADFDAQLDRYRNSLRSDDDDS